MSSSSRCVHEDGLALGVLLRHFAHLQANILKVDEIRHAVKGIDTVFHTAACLDYWSRLAFQRPRIYEINVVGAKARS